MTKSEIRKLILLILIFLTAVLIVQSIYYANLKFEKINNHQIAEKILEKDLKDSWDEMDSSLAKINELLQNKNLSNSDMGRLYERAGLIYLQKNETMTYYKYLGYALYYLKQSDEKDYTINVYLDLANFYLNNYSYDAAERMLAEAEKTRDFRDIETPQIQAYAYRMLGIMSMMNLKYNDAETYFITSQKVIDNTSDGTFQKHYTAMNDIWLGRVYEETGRLSKCKEKLDKWSDSEMFTTEIYRTILLRDFIIPYYQTKCYYLCAENIKERNPSGKMDSDAREQAVIDYLHEFMALCEETNYEKAELYTILKIQREYPTKNETIRNEWYNILNQLYAAMFNQQNITYSSVVEDIVDDASIELEQLDIEHRHALKRAKLIIISVLAIGVLILVFVIIILNNRLDGLTKLLTRKVFNHDLNKAIKSKAPYGIIMIDIDDFKHINDTYGHPEGDIVLWRLGQIITKETTSDIHAYRYGGEEFALLIGKSGVAYVPKIADRLCQYMRQQAWDFDTELIITLSIGCAVGSGYSDVLKEADNNLYYSKSHGKDQATCSSLL